jgi:hypothetical protein
MMQPRAAKFRPRQPTTTCPLTHFIFSHTAQTLLTLNQSSLQSSSSLPERRRRLPRPPPRPLLMLASEVVSALSLLEPSSEPLLPPLLLSLSLSLSLSLPLLRRAPQAS